MPGRRRDPLEPLDTLLGRFGAQHPHAATAHVDAKRPQLTHLPCRLVGARAGAQRLRRYHVRQINLQKREREMRTHINEPARNIQNPIQVACC